MRRDMGEGISITYRDRLDRFADCGGDVTAEVHRLCVACDADFVPPLSARSETGSWDRPTDGTVNGYLMHLRGMQSLLAMEHDTAVGALCFTQDGRGTTSVQCVMVDPAHRRRGIARRLYAHLLELLASRGDVNDRVRVRTWVDETGELTNHAHLALLAELGFSREHLERDSRGPGLGSVHLERPVQV